MIIILLVIFIHQDFIISINYNFEIIEELIPKTIIFKSDDLNPFKIFQYIPSCPENDNYQKSIYLQMLNTRRGTQHIYIYDDFSKIAQKSNSEFENYIDHLTTYSSERSVLFSNIDCKKKYYFVILLEVSRYSSEYFPTLSGIHFNIIDGENGIINVSPELSDIFSFHQRDIIKKLHFIPIMYQNMVYLVLVLIQQKFKFIKIIRLFMIKEKKTTKKKYC